MADSLKKTNLIILRVKEDIIWHIYKICDIAHDRYSIWEQYSTVPNSNNTTISPPSPLTQIFK